MAVSLTTAAQAVNMPAHVMSFTFVCFYLLSTLCRSRLLLKEGGWHGGPGGHRVFEHAERYVSS